MKSPNLKINFTSKGFKISFKILNMVLHTYRFKRDVIDINCDSPPPPPPNKHTIPPHHDNLPRRDLLIQAEHFCDQTTQQVIIALQLDPIVLRNIVLPK